MSTDSAAEVPTDAEVPTVDGVRELRDPRDMRALAHPIRMALLEVLAAHGPLTATQAGELIGESPSSCSFHLRTLARHNFVEETGEGRGRERPWRMIATGLRMSGPYEDSGTDIAAEALTEVFLDQQYRRLQEAQGRGRIRPDGWAHSGESIGTMAWLTDEELDEIDKAVFDVIMRYRDRSGDPTLRPEGARLVELIYHSFLSALGEPRG